MIQIKLYYKYKINENITIKNRFNTRFLTIYLKSSTKMNCIRVIS